MTLPDKIRAARHRANLTQRQLAERAGLAKITISQYEIGLRSPSLPTLAKLAAALNTTASALLR
jgi:transcriptional regulator with XRE-family HTH domain